LTYLDAHYPDGVSSVFAKPDTSTEFVIIIVANKYKPGNYWSGRWRSRYVVDFGKQQVSGKIYVNVHYYEQGNVQLATTHDVCLVIPPAILSSSSSGSASKILALIEEEERMYQSTLGDSYHEMGEKTFKGLRRALPITRQKIDWDKVLGYKLGAELTASKGVFDK